ncbi:MAG: CoA transferase [Dehalococcoidia bacterium]|nr:MAG: CoA transferase [Dehalococcoidia bacterium]
MTQMLEGIRVLEFATDVAGPFAGKLLADYGAEVLKVEPPAGDPSRSAGPFPDDIPHPEKSGLFLHLNTNKQSMTLNLETEEGTSIARRLIGHADVVIDDFRPGTLDEWGLDYEAMSTGHPDLIMASITPFGQSGPWRDYVGTEITLQAMGGPLHGNGAPYREPAKLGGNTAHYHAGLATSLAILLARLRVEAGGAGDWIDQSVYEAQAGFRDRRTISLTAAAYSGLSSTRQPPGGRTAMGVRPAIDGYVNIFAGGTKHFGAFLDEIGRPDLKEHPDFGKQVHEYSAEYQEQVEGSYLAWLFETPKLEAVARTQRHGILGGAVMSTEDLVNDPHYRGRGVWETIDHPVAGPLEYPGRQLILSESPKASARPAPLLGAQTFDVLMQLGYDRAALPRLRAQGVI